MINCIIIDDEELAVKIAADYIGKMSQFQLMETFSNGREAIDTLESGNVDLIFLDIQMPAMNGIALLESLRVKPAVVITTSYPEYALDGYRLNVVDYLLKPFLFERFEQACMKALEYISYKKLMHSSATPNGPLIDYLFVRANSKMVKISFDSILYIEGLKQYVKIMTNSGCVITRETFKMLEGILPQGKFLRIHKSYLIHTEKISSMRNSRIEINKVELPIGKKYKKDVLTALTTGKR